MTKYCPCCKAVKEASDFHKNARRRDGLQNYCKQCKQKADRSNYLKNPERKYRENRAHKQDVRLKVYDYLSLHPCVDCGETDPIFLEFDHVKGEKRHNIADLNHQTRAWSLIEEEMSKCVVRCIKCHRIKTARELGWYKWLERARRADVQTEK